MTTLINVTRKSLNWSVLPDQEGDIVELKGFLYPLDQNEWILASEPNLKSCCIGSITKNSSQITLVGDFSRFSTHTPLTCRGVFHFSENGKYFLRDVEMNQKEVFPLWTLSAIICIIAAALFIPLVRRRKPH